MVCDVRQISMTALNTNAKTTAHVLTESSHMSVTADRDMTASTVRPESSGATKDITRAVMEAFVRT